MRETKQMDVFQQSDRFVHNPLGSSIQASRSSTLINFVLFSTSFMNQQAVEKAIFPRLLKKGQMQAPCGAFHLPVRQAILRGEAYFSVRRNDLPC